MNKNFFTTIFFSFLLTAILAQNPNRIKEPDIMKNPVRREIIMPTIPGYEIIKGDFHTHTVFSDGLVWPTIRVEEAYYDGLDAIALTEHIEYLPFRELVKGDHNTAYTIARPRADQMNILLVQAAEITRAMPPGHIVALFVEDANKLETDEYMDALVEARRQGAFLFWAHPGWVAQQPDTTLWWDVHTQLLEQDLLHGVEVFNWDDWYPVSMQWAKEKNLTWFANSDVHPVVSHSFNTRDFMRPMNLVFAQDRSLEALKEALFEQRSVAFFLDNLAGPEHLLLELFNHSVEIGRPFTTDRNGNWRVQLRNPTDLTFRLQNLESGNGATRSIVLHPRSSVIITCPASENGQTTLQYKATNLHTGMFEHPTITIIVE